MNQCLRGSIIGWHEGPASIHLFGHFHGIRTLSGPSGGHPVQSDPTYKIQSRGSVHSESPIWRCRSDAKVIAGCPPGCHSGLDGVNAAVGLPDFQLRAVATMLVAIGDCGNQVEDLAVAGRAEQLDVFRVRPHQGRGRTGRLAEVKMLLGTVPSNWRTPPARGDKAPRRGRPRIRSVRARRSTVARRVRYPSLRRGRRPRAARSHRGCIGANRVRPACRP
jgi:hypothetical protein